MENTQTIGEIMETLMTGFDFDKVHAYMVLTGWTWRGEKESPTVEDLKSAAGSLIWQAYEKDERQCHRKDGDEGWLVGTGGFYVCRFRFGGKDCYRLTFEPFRSSTF